MLKTFPVVKYLIQRQHLVQPSPHAGEFGVQHRGGVSGTWDHSPGMNLCVNFDPGVVRNHVIRNGDSLENRDSLLDDGVVLHAAQKNKGS
jgi:hypothetical protein